MLPHAPGVQMADIPEDSLDINQDELRDAANPDTRVSSIMKVMMNDHWGTEPEPKLCLEPKLYSATSATAPGAEICSVFNICRLFYTILWELGIVFSHYRYGTVKQFQYCRAEFSKHIPVSGNGTFILLFEFVDCFKKLKTYTVPGTVTYGSVNVGLEWSCNKEEKSRATRMKIVSVPVTVVRELVILALLTVSLVSIGARVAT